MPIYPLKCESCGHRFEKLLSFKELEQAACPQCGSGELARDYMKNTFCASSSPSTPGGGCGFS